MLFRGATILGALLLALCTGYLAGRIVGLRMLREEPIILRPYEGPRVPVIEVEALSGAMVIGHRRGDVRFFWGDTPVNDMGSGLFMVPLRSILGGQELDVREETALFLASKKGRKYYPVGSSAGQRIVKENRIYFSSREEAEKAGFIRGD